MDYSLVTLFPFLSELSETEKKQMIHMEVVRGQIILAEGTVCNHASFVYEGEIKLVKMNKNGREVNLYRLTPGQVCILTVTCALSNQPFPAYAIADKDTKLFSIEKQQLQSLLSKYSSLQNLFHQTTAERFANVMGLFDYLCFRRIDERIVEFLLENLPTDKLVLHITHEEIAAELGTAREVISRVMKGLEKAGGIRLSRGKIFMISREKLENFNKRNQ
jgi:CRP/FNR family transcriptional regulator, anaerobic regulatory protein